MLLSGGVDSSTVMKLCKAAGHYVEAFYLHVWYAEDFDNSWHQCPSEDDLWYARAACASAGVPLHSVPLTSQYWSGVVQECLHEIVSGRTPNPDVLCNARVKFGAFVEHLQREFGFGSFDRIASGHYASICRSYGEPSLLTAADSVKDQTYFLSKLSKSTLRKLMFPLGQYTKEEVRELAEERFELPNADRHESQGICFLGKVPFRKFIERNVGTESGTIFEAETGRELGTHSGTWFFTIGQRQGLRLSHGPWYVVAKDPEANALFVSRHYNDESKRRDAFEVSSISWIGGDDTGLPEAPLGSSARCLVKVRHGRELHICTLSLSDRGNDGHVQLDKSDQGLAPGQYAVFYTIDAHACLGSGIIAGSPAAPLVTNSDATNLEHLPEGVALR